MGKLLALIVVLAAIALIVWVAVNAFRSLSTASKKKSRWEPDFRELPKTGIQEVFIHNGLTGKDRREIFVEKVPVDDSLGLDVAMGLAEERADAKNNRGKNKWQRLLN